MTRCDRCNKRTKYLEVEEQVCIDCVCEDIKNSVRHSEEVAINISMLHKCSMFTLNYKLKDIGV